MYYVTGKSKWWIGLSTFVLLTPGLNSEIFQLTTIKAAIMYIGQMKEMLQQKGREMDQEEGKVWTNPVQEKVNLYLEMLK